MQIEWFSTPEGKRPSVIRAVNNGRRDLGSTPRATGAMPLADRATYLGPSTYIQAQRRLGRG